MDLITLITWQPEPRNDLNRRCVRRWRRAREPNRTKTQEEGGSVRTVSAGLCCCISLYDYLFVHITYLPAGMPYLLLLLRLKLCNDWYASPTAFASDNMGEELGYSPPYANILSSGQEQECWFSVRRRRYSQNEPTWFRTISLYSLMCSFYCCQLASSLIANAAHFCFTVPSLFLPLVHISISKFPRGSNHWFSCACLSPCSFIPLHHRHHHPKPTTSLRFSPQEAIFLT